MTQLNQNHSHSFLAIEAGYHLKMYPTYKSPIKKNKTNTDKTNGIHTISLDVLNGNITIGKFSF